MPDIDVARLRCYAFRYADLFEAYCGNSLASCDYAGLKVPVNRLSASIGGAPTLHTLNAFHEKHGRAEKRIMRCASSDVACYAMRNPDLSAAWCGGATATGDASQCEWAALLQHYADAGRAEGRPYGCEGDDVRCYATRYPDLLDGGYCGGSLDRCDWRALREHWAASGEQEGRIFGCSPPSPPAPLLASPPPAGSLSPSLAPGGGPPSCRLSRGGLVWVVATPAEAAPLFRHLKTTSCAAGAASDALAFAEERLFSPCDPPLGGPFATHRSADGRHMLAISGRGRALAAAAVGYASVLSGASRRRGSVAWMNVGIGAHGSLSAGTLRGLRSVYDSSRGTYASFSAPAAEGVELSLGVSVLRPAEMASLQSHVPSASDAIFDSEAAGFLEVGRLVAPLEQLAALKVVAIRPTATAWPSPTDSAVEMLVEHAWPQVRLVADKMLAALPQEAADRCSGC